MSTATKAKSLKLEDFHHEWSVLRDNSNTIQRKLIVHAYFEYVLGVKKPDIASLLASWPIPWIREEAIHELQLAAYKKGGITTAAFWERVRIVDYPIKMPKAVWLSEDNGIEAVHEFLNILSQKARYPEILRDIRRVLQKQKVAT